MALRLARDLCTGRKPGGVFLSSGQFVPFRNEWSAGLCKNCRSISCNEEIGRVNSISNNAPFTLVEDCFP